MPIPTPELLFLPEAATYVATRCAVPQNKAEAALERAIRIDQKIVLFDDKGKALFPHELEEMRIGWHTGIVETRSAGVGASRRLLVLRCQLDDWTGAPIAKAEPHLIEHGSAATTRPRAPDHKVRAWYKEYLKEHLDKGTATSGEDDWAAAQAKFGDAVRQPQIRKLRIELAPPAWRKRGRRPGTKAQ
jgi:hypothetical protein